MTITAKVHGNILDSKIQTLVCPVNVAGAMGAGLALEFRQEFSGLYAAYQKACRAGIFASKGLFVYKHSSNCQVLCLPSKRHWRDPSRLVWIDLALSNVAENYLDYGITALAIPAVGCGLGGLDWNDVQKLIHQYFDTSALPVTIFLP